LDFDIDQVSHGLSASSSSARSRSSVELHDAIWRNVDSGSRRDSRVRGRGTRGGNEAVWDDRMILLREVLGIVLLPQAN